MLGGVSTSLGCESENRLEGKAPSQDHAIMARKKQQKVDSKCI